MRCTNCGTDAPDQATRCPDCGAPLAASTPPAGSDGGWGSAVPGGGSDPSPPVGGPSGWPPPSSTPDYQQPTGYPLRPGGWGAGGGGGYPAPPAWDSGPPMGGRVGSLAGWWYRVGATLIDWVILAVVNLFLGAVGGRGLDYVGGIVAGLLYDGLLLANRGQTVGMMAVGTRCIKAQTGQYLSVGAAMGRYVLWTLLEITVIGGLLDILWPLWDANNQTIHDKAVGSLIVHAR